MSDFFSSLISGISTPQGGGSLLSGILGAGASLGSAAIRGSADQAAANTIADNQAAARDQFQKSAAQGEGFIDQGAGQYASTIAPLMSQAPIAMPTYRDLTTQQQLGEADLMRNGQAQLAASGLRGAGRAGIGSLLDADSRYQAAARTGNDASTLQAMQTAQQTQNQARTGLANVQAAAGTAKANTAIGAGSQIGGSYQQQGNALGNLTVQSGNNSASGLSGAVSAIQPTLGTLAAIGNSPNSTGPNAYGSYVYPNAGNVGTGGTLGGGV